MAQAAGQIEVAERLGEVVDLLRRIADRIDALAPERGTEQVAGGAAVPDRLLRMEQVCEKVALRPSRIYQLIKERDFPKPQRIGGAVRWRQSEVMRWIEELPEA